MEFELNLDELVENFYLDGVYEEIIAFENITETLFGKLKGQEFQEKMIKYLNPSM